MQELMFELKERREGGKEPTPFTWSWEVLFDWIELVLKLWHWRRISVLYSWI
jgi:hypothetical protein